VLTGFLLLISGVAVRRLSRFKGRPAPLPLAVAAAAPVPPAVPAARAQEQPGLPARGLMLIGVLGVGAGMTLRRRWRSPS
jgi:hypothetical protein